MPRFVNVRAVCERCESAEAVSYCETEKENQCQSCDGRVHFGIGGLIGHMRRPLNPSVTVLGVCQRCGETPAGVCAHFDFLRLSSLLRHKVL